MTFRRTNGGKQRRWKIMSGILCVTKGLVIMCKKILEWKDTLSCRANNFFALWKSTNCSAPLFNLSSLIDWYKIVLARLLNMSKFVHSSCLARDPRVHARLENKAGFFKHSKLEIVGSWAFAILESSINLCSESWSPAQAQTIRFLTFQSSCLAQALVEHNSRIRFKKRILKSWCLARA